MTVESVAIFFATETGTSEEMARLLGRDAEARGLQTEVTDLADVGAISLMDVETALFIASTTGEGDAPYSAQGFFEQLSNEGSLRLGHLRYAVLSLGDSSYQHFCSAGRRLDERLSQLGAVRLLDRVDCDVDYDDPALQWRETVLGLLTVRPAAPVAPVRSLDPEQARLQKYKAVEATVIQNRLLVGPGSSKATRHLAFAFADRGVMYEPGDVLGVIVENDPDVTSSLLAASGLAAEETVEMKGAHIALGDALRKYYEITTATPRFIEAWAALSGVDELAALLSDRQSVARTAFLREHHIVDILRRYPVHQLDAQSLVQSLRPLQPRSYSIASSLRTTPGEVHLTVSPVAYPLHGEVRKGVASSQLSERTPVNSRMHVYVQTSTHFRLPASEIPIVMIGAGTGIAPYRAFLQHRAAGSTAGPAWLFFGERNRADDFLYEEELREFLASGVLTRLDAVFSRDDVGKTYVQHRMLERASELARWIAGGAHVYVCGDGTHMAPDVHEALIRTIEQGLSMTADEAEAYVSAMRQAGRYQRDVY